MSAQVAILHVCTTQIALPLSPNSKVAELGRKLERKFGLQKTTQTIQNENHDDVGHLTSKCQLLAFLARLFYRLLDSEVSYYGNRSHHHQKHGHTRHGDGVPTEIRQELRRTEKVLEQIVANDQECQECSKFIDGRHANEALFKILSHREACIQFQNVIRINYADKNDGLSELKQLNFARLHDKLQEDFVEFKKLEPTDSKFEEAIKDLARAVPEEFTHGTNLLGMKKGQPIMEVAKEVVSHIYYINHYKDKYAEIKQIGEQFSKKEMPNLAAKLEFENCAINLDALTAELRECATKLKQLDTLVKHLQGVYKRREPKEKHHLHAYNKLAEMAESAIHTLGPELLRDAEKTHKCSDKQALNNLDAKRARFAELLHAQIGPAARTLTTAGLPELDAFNTRMQEVLQRVAAKSGGLQEQLKTKN